MIHFLILLIKRKWNFFIFFYPFYLRKIISKYSYLKKKKRFKRLVEYYYNGKRISLGNKYGIAFFMREKKKIMYIDLKNLKKKNFQTFKKCFEKKFFKLKKKKETFHSPFLMLVYTISIPIFCATKCTERRVGLAHTHTHTHVDFQLYLREKKIK